MIQMPSHESDQQSLNQTLGFWATPDSKMHTILSLPLCTSGTNVPVIQTVNTIGHVVDRPCLEISLIRNPSPWTQLW